MCAPQDATARQGVPRARLDPVPKGCGRGLGCSQSCAPPPHLPTRGHAGRVLTVLAALHPLRGACGTNWRDSEATCTAPPRGDGLAEGRGGLSVRVRVQAWRSEWGGGSREDERERQEEGAERREERRGERREEGAGRRRDQGAGRRQARPGRCSLPGRLLGQRVLAASAARSPPAPCPPRAAALSRAPGPARHRER